MRLASNWEPYVSFATTCPCEYVIPKPYAVFHIPFPKKFPCKYSGSTHSREFYKVVLIYKTGQLLLAISFVGIFKIFFSSRCRVGAPFTSAKRFFIKFRMSSAAEQYNRILHMRFLRGGWSATHKSGEPCSSNFLYC